MSFKMALVASCNQDTENEVFEGKSGMLLKKVCATLTGGHWLRSNSKLKDFQLLNLQTDDCELGGAGALWSITVVSFPNCICLQMFLLLWWWWQQFVRTTIQCERLVLFFSSSSARLCQKRLTFGFFFWSRSQRIMWHLQLVNISDLFALNILDIYL